MSDELTAKLAEARNLFAKKDDRVMDAVSALASEKYEPSIPLILQMLDAESASWRDTALSALAEWETWSLEVIGRIRKVLTDDEDENLRVSAAGMLGANNNEWPDPSLERALEKDPSRRVREFALGSALTLIGMSWPEVQSAMADVKEGKAEPRTAALNAIVERWRKKNHDARPLLDAGWKREGGALVWQGESGTSMRLEETAHGARLELFFAGKHSLEYVMAVEPEQERALAAALAASTPELGRLSHAGFSASIAGIATEVAVKTTEGYWVRPWLENGELRWEPLDRARG